MSDLPLSPITSPGDYRLPLSDQLAIDRTHLANERTLLAYLRTGIALVVAGFSLINFFREGIYIGAGILLVPTGLLAIVLGWRRCQRRSRHIEQHVDLAIRRRSATP
ncbi:DUF202 domain-containing protein [Hymenobacter aerophilus]|uniref:DUF202 domain-containing protein n=1 Tax=Hymenobacter aerophilus TaxID=119644 RepID=UPI00037C2706|nr:DUF202 domain-containing protein [Hymenobacter aerophilus]